MKNLEATVAQDSLAIEFIRRSLTTEIVGFAIHLLGVVPSTNIVLRQLAEAGAREGTVVLAEAQTAGRGRAGKPWFSPPGVNLYASVLFRPSFRARAVPVFSFIASLALCEALSTEGVAATIKWPNDILVDGRKIAGSLVAYTTTGDVVDYVILGAGVNLNVGAADLARGLGATARAATSVRELTGRFVDRNAFTAAFLNALERWFGVYRHEGPDAVLAAWRERDALAARHVEIRGEGQPYRARVVEVDDEGHLLVEDGRGTRRQVVAGEIVILD